MKKQAAPEESGEKAPLWIISFADMISLLMAFFVMLQTLAAEHTNEFQTTGREILKATAFEFRRNIDGFGLPGLLGAPSHSPYMQATQKKFAVESSDPQTSNPAVDGEAEQLRRLFTKLAEHSKANISQFRGQHQIFEAAPITFEKGGTTLDSEARQFLTHFSALLEQDRQFENTLICIVGIGADVEDQVQQWKVSELRARQVALFLQSMLPEKCRQNVYWWGAGPAMDGIRADQKPFILISISSSVTD